MNVGYPSPPPGSGIETRAAGFAVLSRLNRWMIAGAAAAAGALSLVAHNSFHGKTKLAATTSQSSQAAATRSAAQQSGIPSSPSVQPAPAPVAVAPVPTVVVSGGS